MNVCHILECIYIDWSLHIHTYMALVYLGGFFLAVKLTVHSFREHDPVTCWQPRRLLALFFFFFARDGGRFRVPQNHRSLYIHSAPLHLSWDDRFSTANYRPCRSSRSSCSALATSATRIYTHISIWPTLIIINWEDGLQDKVHCYISFENYKTVMISHVHKSAL